MLDNHHMFGFMKKKVYSQCRKFGIHILQHELVVKVTFKKLYECSKHYCIFNYEQYRLGGVYYWMLYAKYS
jgi:hypothetical protein